MNIQFSNRTALVTGAGRGIGRALAVKLDELGARVVAVSRSAANLESLRAECPRVVAVQLDLADWAASQAKLRPLADQVDFLVNNAASSNSELVGEIGEPSLDSMFALNYKACLNLIQLVAPGMKARRFGSIVNVSSVSGLAALEGHCVYGSTKAALDMLTKIAAKELGPFNVRVNSLNPTVVWTDMGASFWSEERKKAAMLAKIPMGRFVELHEVVGPIVFLLSELAAMINGVQLPVDGGFTAT